MTKSKRTTIRPHNVEFLETIAAQMGISDISIALDYLLLDCKGLGYSFGNKPASVPQQAPIGFDSCTFEPTFAPIPNADRNYQEIDPIIARMSQIIV